MRPPSGRRQAPSWLGALAATVLTAAAADAGAPRPRAADAGPPRPTAANAGAPRPTAAETPPGTPAAPALHAHLVSSVPAAGETLRVPPDVVRLVFSEPVEEAFSEIVLSAAGGVRLPLVPARDPENVRTLVADVPALAGGSWRASWRIVSADGHPVAGSFVFHVRREAGPPGPVEAPPPPEPEGGHPHGAAAGTTGEPPVAAAILRGSSLGALMALFGILAMLAWVAPGPARRLDAVALGLAAATPLLLAADFLLWFQHASRAADFGADRLAAALGTQTGAVSALRLGLAALALWALGLARRRGAAARFAALALLLTGATGHPAAIHPLFAVPAKAVHLMAAALWMGGLLVLLLGDRDERAFRSDAARVSRVALAAVLAIAVTGAVQALLFLPSPADLVRSTYGWLVLGKLAGLGVLIGFGARNRCGLLPPLAAGAPRSALRRSVGLETAVMAAVILLAAFLAYIPPPSGRDLASRARDSHAHATPTPGPEPRP